ncbi:uncharacterized protein [Triticum aestivum]|uniref:uncharacterized protein isoform X1 n=1 Tax=Triticum aestivum TaxID=4565 RepID=UPI001D00D5B9|nr:uncharacterized protein LOC123113311 isoform X1 [Triticum aestivum]
MAREHANEKMSYRDPQNENVTCEKIHDEMEKDEITGSPTHDVDGRKGAWGILTPVPPSPLYLQYDDTTYGGIISPLADYVTWPSVPRIVPLEEGSMEGGENCSTYTVEPPSGSPTHDKMIYEEYAPRRQMQKLEKVEEVATNRMRKRDAEGLLKAEDKAKFQAGVKRLGHVAAALADRPFSQDRLLLGDRDGIQIG